MNHNAIIESIKNNLVALWLWVATFIAYLISIALPILGSNVEKWLTPFLASINAPDFIQSDFTVYATVFGLIGIITTKLVRFLIVADDRYKYDVNVKLRAKVSENKVLKNENKNLLRKIKSIENSQEECVKNAKIGWDKDKLEEINSINRSHSDDLNRMIDEYERDKRRMQECLRLQDVALDAMKNYKSVENDIQEYNSAPKSKKHHKINQLDFS